MRHHQIDPALVDLLVQQLALLLTRVPPYVDPERLLAEPDAHADQLRDPVLARALGWIEGLADAADLTVLELLDEAGVVVGALRPLPARS